jgi:hypothetical protein
MLPPPPPSCASCVAVITSYEASRLAPGSVGKEVSGLAQSPGLGKGWLEVAKECGCATPGECALFPAPGEDPASADLALRVIRVEGKDCRRPPAG